MVRPDSSSGGPAGRAGLGPDRPSSDGSTLLDVAPPPSPHIAYWDTAHAHLVEQARLAGGYARSARHGWVSSHYFRAVLTLRDAERIVGRFCSLPNGRRSAVHIGSSDRLVVLAFHLPAPPPSGQTGEVASTRKRPRDDDGDLSRNVLRARTHDTDEDTFRGRPVEALLPNGYDGPGRDAGLARLWKFPRAMFARARLSSAASQTDDTTRRTVERAKEEARRADPAIDADPSAWSDVEHVLRSMDKIRCDPQVGGAMNQVNLSLNDTACRVGVLAQIPTLAVVATVSSGLSVSYERLAASFPPMGPGQLPDAIFEVRDTATGHCPEATVSESTSVASSYGHAPLHIVVGIASKKKVEGP